ncbi:MAG: AmmeMemoRadiSam system radical SAM enzyme [bacterium]
MLTLKNMDYTTLKPAMFYDAVGDGYVKCRLCAHSCKIPPDSFGACGVRINAHGTLYALTFGCAISKAKDPIEKKPLFHFYPGSHSLSIATPGCNFECSFCQNYSISQVQAQLPDIFIDPHNIVTSAKSNSCASISFTYTEPTIFYEYAYTIGIEAKKHGIKNVFVSNGYMSRETANHAKSFIDAINIDLKFFNNKTYKKLCKGSLEPVLNTIQTMYDNGIWVEITTLIIPKINDSREELNKIAEFIAKVSPDIPWHISRFHPDYKLKNAACTPESSLSLAYEAGKSAGLNYIYSGNVPGHPLESTYCPGCRKMLIERFGYFIKQNTISNNKCPYCKYIIKGFY